MRKIVIDTWDYGRLRIDLEKDSSFRIRWILDKILRERMWGELRKFPPEIISQHLSSLKIPRALLKVVNIFLRASAS